MKPSIYIAAIFMAIGMLSSCDKPSELPPLNTNYDTDYVLPVPEDLTSEERAAIEALREEYKQATTAQQQ